MVILVGSNVKPGATQFPGTLASSNAFQARVRSASKAFRITTCRTAANADSKGLTEILGGLASAVTKPGKGGSGTADRAHS